MIAQGRVVAQQRVGFCNQSPVFGLRAGPSTDSSPIRPSANRAVSITRGSAIPHGTEASASRTASDAVELTKREHGMADGVRHARTILRDRGAGLIGHPADLGVVRAWAYWNRCGLDFTDTNNPEPRRLRALRHFHDSIRRRPENCRTAGITVAVGEFGSPPPRAITIRCWGD